MTLKLIVLIFCWHLTDALVISNSDNQVPDTRNDKKHETEENNVKIHLNNSREDNINQVFDGAYTECFLHLSYSCLQKKTLLYLKELDKLQEVSVIGDYVKFVKVNDTTIADVDSDSTGQAEELSTKIDEAVDVFFNNHILKFRAMGRDVAMPNSVDEFVGRKRKGGGGGGGGHGHGGDDGGKKKMMMMAMMCMKMKFMMMVPAMLGMMGMMSFKGMMFSMMSFMMAKMMLLMKLLEKKGMGMGGGGGGGWNDGGGWAAGGGGGGGGAWMPAGGQDYSGGGGAGGYDANAQWQSRSIIGTSEDTIYGPESNTDAEGPIHGHRPPTDDGISTGFTPKNAVEEKEELELNKPIITYVKPKVSYNNKISGKKPFFTLKKLRDEVIKIKHVNDDTKVKSRKKRGIVDLLQTAYLYWINKVLNLNSFSKYPRYPKYKVVNGVKYVYYPIRYSYVQSPKMPKDLKHVPQSTITANMINANLLNTETEDSLKPVVAVEDFNKGEIFEGPVEGRMTKKLNDFKDTLNEALEDNPWQ